MAKWIAICNDELQHCWGRDYQSSPRHRCPLDFLIDCQGDRRLSLCANHPNHVRKFLHFIIDMVVEKPTTRVVLSRPKGFFRSVWLICWYLRSILVLTAHHVTFYLNCCCVFGPNLTLPPHSYGAYVSTPPFQWVSLSVF